mgnify:CR=1 FL=1
MKLIAEETVLLVIDVQEKIFSAMHEKEKTKQNICRLIEGSKILNIPVVWTEQYPNGLGRTLSEVSTALNGAELLEKITFSCLGDDVVSNKIKSYQKNQVLVCGVETHVCIYQTVQDLLINNYDVHVVTDAAMSRHKENHDLGLKKMGTLGAKMTSVEMALFELQQIASGDIFKAIASIIK